MPFCHTFVHVTICSFIYVFIRNVIGVIIHVKFSYQMNKKMVSSQKGYLGSMSVKMPSAHITNPCSVRTDMCSQMDVLYTKWIGNQGNYSKIGAVVELMYIGGVRVSEALRVRPTDVTSRGDVMVRGLKGSNDRLVTPLKYQSFWLRYRSGGGSVESEVSRFYVYREMRKHGLYMKYGNNQLNSVTHMFRHLKALSMRDGGMEQEAISHILGHKQVSNSKFYMVDGKKRT